MPGFQEWILILLIVLVLFGAKRLPELARSLGQSMNEFRKAKDEFEREIHKSGQDLETKKSEEPPTSRSRHARSPFPQDNVAPRWTLRIYRSLRAPGGASAHRGQAVRRDVLQRRELAHDRSLHRQ